MSTSVPTPDPVPGLAPGELVEADPKRPHKAYVSAAATALVTFIYLWIEDRTGRHGFTSEELFENLGASILASGLVGVPTFLKKNPKQFKRDGKRGLWDRRNQGGVVNSTLVIVAVVVVVIVLLVVVLPGLNFR